MTDSTPSAVSFASSVTAQAAPRASDDLLWSALTSDAGCGVVIYDLNGRIVSCNAAGAGMLGLESEADAGTKGLHEIVPAPLAEERLAHARKAVDGLTPVVIDGMVNGRMTRATLRPIRGESDHELRILETIRIISADEPRPDGVQYVRAKTDDEGEISRLTAREREVLFHIGHGLSTADIASTLGRSTKTVEWHRVSLGTKLGITNRVELARIAIRAGLSSLRG